MSTCSQQSVRRCPRGVVDGEPTETHQAYSTGWYARAVAARSVCVELRVHRDLVQSSPASAAAEHIQPSLDITLWYTKSALPASDSFHDDKR